ncbi:MAG: ABC transporter ATP-binding protein [Deltaproteobacteria bacterium]|nr:ABC transporter ATP-binding protein [Deltaproteobacteria bacterium]MBW1922428.1 ABC transporter ATP-binding protein [Deltaproteobacteria bacterium]MBW1949351.1 ABC transporter ATP-binding protein [Deltaproteobacteria bacterium]MBW2007271.1 ABC transporter ATP-binding protein [Deltaproteobacteria bacterium]MBW2101300.1 ABC transporter ATP-binding protein [Deltaproteobacteria bacterium]
MALLEVDNLSIGYQTRNGTFQAVDGVSFSLESGRSLGFVGESGCGKTTLGLALMGLLPPNGRIRQGSIRFEGEELVGLPEDRMRTIRWRKIAMVFQAAMNALNPVHRVADQVAEAIFTHEPALSREEVNTRVEGLFQLVGVPKDRMRDYPHQYSGGMKQRAVIAMALACRPRLIIADEPTTALDVIVQDQILEETKNLQQQFGISIIFISHDISIVADVCHDIGIMYAGQIVEYGAREEVFETPVHPYTRALLASYPTLNGTISRLKPIPGETPNLISPPPGCRFCDRCPGAGKTCVTARPSWVEISPRHKALCHSCS